VPYRPRLKICGVTNAADARLVGECGADYCGIVVDVAVSQRSLSPEEARQVASACAVPVVALLFDADSSHVERVVQAVSPWAVQLLGSESPELVGELAPRLGCQIWKTLHLGEIPGQASVEEYADAGAEVFLVDSCDVSDGVLRPGGTGKLADWDRAAELVERSPKPVFLAGGIDAVNVPLALAKVRPWGIDLCSGVEASKGRKDPEKVRRLVATLRSAALAVEERGA
jgi:phosphoribosylanthranilate isomerase